MSYSIIFDTNYLKTFGIKEFSIGEIPSKLKEQIKFAVGRGDVVALPNTVRFEFNAHLKKIQEKDKLELNKAIQLLEEKGYTINPPANLVVREIDVWTILNNKFPDIYLLEPSIEDYLEAEKRTSYRLPPLPKKKPESEEFRDRLIWCQLVRYAKNTDTTILIVSEDGIFENGAESNEGKTAKIENVKGETELDQRLDQWPTNIQKMIEKILMFSNEFKLKGINLSKDIIIGIDGLRKVNESGGVARHNFVLRIKEVKNMPIMSNATMICIGEMPIELSLSWNGNTIELERQLSKEDLGTMNYNRLQGEVNMEKAKSELKAILGV
ncbi:MAG: DUF4935 domain-containing protein [Kordiimonadaceae bacterium]|nr:DUF4935 domain-containing protein [Kordiimonadaceae bacterium]